MSADAPEVYAGIIDRLLALRNTPITAELLGDFENGRRYSRDQEILLRPLSARWQAHQDAVDACIDAIMPGLRALISLPARVTHGDGNCVSKAEVERLLGRVPFDRQERFHTGDWRVRE